MDIRTRPVELCHAFNAHDLDRIMEHFAEECVLEMPRGPEPWDALHRQGRGADRLRGAP